MLDIERTWNTLKALSNSEPRDGSGRLSALPRVVRDKCKLALITPPKTAWGGFFLRSFSTCHFTIEVDRKKLHETSWCTMYTTFHDNWINRWYLWDIIVTMGQLSTSNTSPKVCGCNKIELRGIGSLQDTSNSLWFSALAMEQLTHFLASKHWLQSLSELTNWKKKSTKTSTTSIWPISGLSGVISPRIPLQSLASLPHEQLHVLLHLARPTG